MFKKIYWLILFLLFIPLVNSVDLTNSINIFNITYCKDNINILIIPITFKGDYYIENCLLKDNIYICKCNKDNINIINFITKKYNYGKIKFYFQYTTDNSLDFNRYNKEIIMDIEKQEISLLDKINWVMIIIITLIISILMIVFYFLYRIFLKKEFDELFGDNNDSKR